MVLDSLDGRVARMTNTQSAFAWSSMDSLSDMVSFWCSARIDCLLVDRLKGFGPLG